MARKVAIIGVDGVPARYGGFETLAECLVRYHRRSGAPVALTVYCSASSYGAKPDAYLSARLNYISLSANGASSILYDLVAMFMAIRSGHDTLLVLGVSGAIGLPIVRLLSSALVLTNIDGVEWKREKWSGFARWFLRLSEWLAVRCSHRVIADNQGILDHVAQEYGMTAVLIPYGGDHAIEALACECPVAGLPNEYALSICRIEPENNVHMILEAFAGRPALSLVFVGNWDSTEYGRDLKARYGQDANVRLLDPIYDTGVLRTIRSGASMYVHGHSAGGTNPSLVEMMHFGLPVLAFDCNFNRYTTEDRALYFEDSRRLASLVAALDEGAARSVGEAMLTIAARRYTWSAVGAAYFDLFETVAEPASERPQRLTT
jgi:glycosyltransferase involved in cell wall biosynthesis